MQDDRPNHSYVLILGLRAQDKAISIDGGDGRGRLLSEQGIAVCTESPVFDLNGQGLVVFVAQSWVSGL